MARDATERVRLMKVSSGLAVEGLGPVVERMSRAAEEGTKAARSLRYEARASKRDSHQRITPTPMPAVEPDTDVVPGAEDDSDE